MYVQVETRTCHWHKFFDEDNCCKSWVETQRFLSRKDMEMACFDLSITNNSETECHGNNAFNTGFSLMNEIIDNFSSRTLNTEMEGTAENRRRFHQLTLEESMSSNKEQSSSDSIVASGSNHVSEKSSVNHSEGKVCTDLALMYGSEVEQLNDRLKTLEEEAAIMKQVFLESMEERKKLMNEICQQFRVIHRCLRSRRQVSGVESIDGLLIVNSPQNGGGAGLSQVLHQQSNPSLVIRDLRATMEAYEEPADTPNRLLFF